MKSCQTIDLCRKFLDAVEKLVADLKSGNLTRPTDAKGYCGMALNCGPVAWDLFHGAAAAFREHVCETCGQDAESLMRAAHDLVNRKLGKPIHAPKDLERWAKVLRQAAPVGSFHQKPEMGTVARSLPFDTQHEAVWALMELPGGGIRRYLVASGTGGEAPVPTTRLLDVAQKEGVRDLWLVHNHPSGSRMPSAEDIDTTSQLSKLAKDKGMELRDHLIVAGDQVVSIMGASKGGAVCDCPLNLRVAQISAPERERRKELGRQLQLTLFGEPRGDITATALVTAPQPAWVNIQLFPFQREGVEWLRDRPRALLADEMGLGKTLQAIAWASMPGKARLPALVVVPASLKLNWEREINRARPTDTVRVLDGGEAWPSPLPDWVVLNYDILLSFRNAIKDTPFKSIILDEAHYIKNLAAKRTQATLELAEAIPNRLLVTGTPMLNRPVEVFSLLLFLGEAQRERYRAFLDRYTEREMVRGRVVFTGAKNLAELHLRLSSVMLRRAKKDVLRQLPPKIQTPLFVGLSNAREYAEAERAFLRWLRQKRGDQAALRAARAEAIVRLNHLRQLAAQGKVAVMNDWLKPCEVSGHKHIVFSSFKEPLNDLANAKAARAVLYTGETSGPARQALVDLFQKDAGKCFFLGTVGAAGVGITLTAADRVVFLDLPWNPGVKVQAEDRAHRIGQRNVVEVVNVLAKHTVDERMAKLMAEKAEVIAQAVEGKTPTEASHTAEAALLEEYLRVADSGQDPPPPLQYHPEDLDGLSVADPWAPLQVSEEQVERFLSPTVEELEGVREPSRGTGTKAVAKGLGHTFGNELVATVMGIGISKGLGLLREPDCPPLTDSQRAALKRIWQDNNYTLEAAQVQLEGQDRLYVRRGDAGGILILPTGAVIPLGYDPFVGLPSHIRINKFDSTCFMEENGKAPETPRQARMFQSATSADCTEMRLPLEAVEIHPESYQYRRGGSEQTGLDPDHVRDLFENFDPNRFDPIVVRRTEVGSYELLSGHHRLAAFKMAAGRGGFPTAPEYDFKTIPALVRTVSLETAQQLARLSNASIKEYKPSELARVFRIEAEAGLTPEQIGKMYGSRRPGEVQQYLDISLLPLDLQELLDVAEVRKSFTVAHAAVLGRAMRVYQIGANTVRQIFDRVLKEREYTAAQLEKLVATFGPQLKEVQLELLSGEEFTGGLTGILGLIRKAMDSIRDLARKRRLLNCVGRLVREKEDAGERVSAELRRSQEQVTEEVQGLDQEIEAVRDRLGVAIRKQPGVPQPEPEAEPETFVVPREQMAMVADPRSRSDELGAIAESMERRRLGVSENNPAGARRVNAAGPGGLGVSAGTSTACRAGLKCAQAREVGHALCRTADGRTVHGPESRGDHDHVDIPLSCPPGSQVYGTFHTHPDGKPAPSDADEREGCRLGLKLLCVSDGRVTRCTRPRC
jgi:SWI/SNF-related matrix-associated actin-dependent regulator 1 of chromatin subfamily A